MTEGSTPRRLENLLETAGEWAAELEIETSTEEQIARIREVIGFVHPEVADRVVRVFPSEEHGLLLQTMVDGLRMVEFADGGFLATFVPDEGSTCRFDLKLDARLAAEFLVQAEGNVDGVCSPWPLTFANAPRVVSDGRSRLRDDVAVELGDRMAHRYASLLERLAEQ